MKKLRRRKDYSADLYLLWADVALISKTKGLLQTLLLQNPPKSPTTRRRHHRGLATIFLLWIIGLGLCLLGYYFPFGGDGGAFWMTPLNLNRSFFQHWMRSRSNRNAALREKGGGCNLPRLDPFAPEIKEFLRAPPKVDCISHHPLRFRTNFRNQLLPVHSGVEIAKGESCCYKTLTRENGSDQNVKYSKKCHPVSLTKTTNIPPDHEFISLRCTRPVQNVTTRSITTTTTHKDMFAFVPLKPEVEARIQRYNKAHPRPPSGENDPLSVIIIGLDAQSRMNFIRQMPRTHAFLLQNLSAVGLSGYTKVGDNTFPNVVPLLTGLSVEGLKKNCWPSAKYSYFDSCPFIWRDFASSGYRTSFAEDTTWMGAFSYEKKGFVTPPTDYYLNPMALLMSKKIGHETLANAKLCYGPRLAFDVLLDYVVKMAVTFKVKDGDTGSKPYFQYIWANSLFHDYLNNPRIGDEVLAMTLEFLSREGFLDRAALILLSDHGARWGGIRTTYQGKVEERMPTCYLAFPPWFKAKYAKEMEALEENANSTLTTPFDIYATMRHILEIGRVKVNQVNGTTESGVTGIGRSLLRPIGQTRSCGDAGVEQHWCVCHKLTSVPRNSSLVTSAARFMVEEINKILRPWSNICTRLTLDRVTEAMQKIGDDEESPSTTPRLTLNMTKPKERIQLQLTFTTSPSEAVFEATLHGELDLDLDIIDPEGWRWTVSGEISRLNLYRDESFCVHDAVAQKYCYCSKLIEDPKQGEVQNSQIINNGTTPTS